ncbi:MAG: ATP-grasp domain-containing protein [Planctomycetes bacterium]|nr:ATP-grasp domain-containing protein [Planctomycetota bacterium]
MKRVLVAFPTAWDERQLAACKRLGERYEIVYASPRAEDSPWDLDVLGWVERTAREHEGRVDGVFTSSDDPGALVAAVLARRLGLPGPSPDAVARAQHKLVSRTLQRAVAPEAVPRFERVDPTRPGGGLPPERFPCFVKPIRAAFSLLARRVEDAHALDAHLARPAAHNCLRHFVEVFEALRRAHTALDADARGFLAEDVLGGVQVTAEGFATGDEIVVLGVVDSTLHPSGSFLRFDAPSCLPAPLLRRVEDVTARVVRAHGLSDTMFNVELMVDVASSAVHVIELNPRMCGQFADLHEKLGGTNGYECALSLAVGERPPRLGGAGRWACAVSRPLRTFRPVRVLAAPSPADLRAAEALAEGVLCWSECSAGEVLSDFETLEDGHSARYGIVNLGGRDAAEVEARLAAVEARLGFRFVELARDTHGQRDAREAHDGCDAACGGT